MIIDASIAFKLVIEEEGSAAAIGWIGRADLVAPALIHAEVGNALWKRVRKREIAADTELEERLSDLARYIRTVDEVPFMHRALRMAVELDHPIYDCVYLAIAEAFDDHLLTADQRFVAAASGSMYKDRVKALEI